MSQLEEGETERCLKNGESAPSSNVDVQSEAANVSASKSFFKQNLVEQVYFHAFVFFCHLKLISLLFHLHIGFEGRDCFVLAAQCASCLL